MTLLYYVVLWTDRPSQIEPFPYSLLWSARRYTDQTHLFQPFSFQLDLASTWGKKKIPFQFLFWTTFPEGVLGILGFSLAKHINLPNLFPSFFIFPLYSQNIFRFNTQQMSLTLFFEDYSWSSLLPASRGIGDMTDYVIGKQRMNRRSMQSKLWESQIQYAWLTFRQNSRTE